LVEGGKYNSFNVGESEARWCLEAWPPVMEHHGASEDDVSERWRSEGEP
jgi:hypothetical protein